MKRLYSKVGTYGPLPVSTKSDRKRVSRPFSENKFKIGDKVRISKYKGTFDKGYLPNCTTELFIISKILNTNPVTYKIKDLNDEDILGSFYEPELVKFVKRKVKIMKLKK
jgi:hypothetical protein